MKKINLLIIGGGTSSEREISLKTSQEIVSAISPDKFNVSFLEITKENEWLIRDSSFWLNQEKHKEVTTSAAAVIKNPETSLINLSKIKKEIDLVFIALHGKDGEDGKVQAFFDLLGVPYTGSGVLASALGMNKSKASMLVQTNGIRVPQSLVVTENNKLADIINQLKKQKISFPCFVKPNEAGSSIGISLVLTENDLEMALNQAFAEDARVIIEELIIGREFTCGVLGNSNENNLIALPVTEIIVHDANFFDYEAKYSSSHTEEICPANITDEIKEKVQNKAKLAHNILGCDGLTRSDFILSSKDGQLYFLEINTIPGQTQASICPKQAQAMGWAFAEFVEKQIELALKKYKITQEN